MSTIPEANHLQQELTKARQEIHNLRKQLNSLKHVQRKDIEQITQTLENWQCSSCKERRSNTELPQLAHVHNNESGNEFVFKPIGVINSEFPRIRGTPRQPPITMNNSTATLTISRDIFTNPSHALEDLHQFSHLWIIFAFHLNDTHAKAKVAPPRLNGERTGVFATRSPHRPCPIGLSLVKIERVVDNVIYFTGVDMVDQTPVFDIKPYIPHYDQPLGLASRVSEEENSLEEVIKDEVDSSDSISNTTSSYENKTSSGDLSVLGNLEREEPDGEESKPAHSSQQNSTLAGQVRVPSWISQSPVHKLSVKFNAVALTQLQDLGSELADERSRRISNVLREDPRSVYLREKLGSKSYVWKIEDLCVECTFNDNDHTVEVTKIFKQGE